MAMVFLIVIGRHSFSTRRSDDREKQVRGRELRVNFVLDWPVWVEELGAEEL